MCPCSVNIMHDKITSYVVANTQFENMAEVRYLETIRTNQNCIHEEITRS